MKRGGAIVRGIWAGCLLIAGANHARILLAHGLSWDYGRAHWASAAYWSSLTLLDPLAAALLFVRPRIGIAATILLIVSNVVHNLTLTARSVPDGEALLRAAAHPFLLAQIGFMLFVAATARIAWKDAAPAR